MESVHRSPGAGTHGSQQMPSLFPGGGHLRQPADALSVPRGRAPTMVSRAPLSLTWATSGFREAKSCSWLRAHFLQIFQGTKDSRGGTFSVSLEGTSAQHKAHPIRIRDRHAVLNNQMLLASTQTCVVPGTQVLSKTLIYSEKVMFAQDYIPKGKHQEKKIY